MTHHKKSQNYEPARQVGIIEQFLTDLLYAALYALVPILMIFVSRSIAGILVITTLTSMAVLALVARHELPRPDRLGTGFYVVMFGVIAFMAINIMNSIDPYYSLWAFAEKMFVLGIIAGHVWLCRRLLPQKMFVWSLIGASVSLFIIATVYLPALKGMDLINVEDPSTLNRSIVTLSVFASLIASLIACLTVWLGRWPKHLVWVIVPVLALILSIILHSASQSATLYLIIFSSVLAALWVFPQLGKVIKFTIPAVIISFPFLVRLIDLQKLAEIDNPLARVLLQDASAVTRLRIWQDAATAAFERFWFGYGFSTESLLSSQASTGVSSSVTGTTHPHSLLIQIWLNGGVLFAIFGAILGFLGFRFLERLPQPLSAFALSIFCGLFAVASVSHGAWQSWWLALCGMACGIISSIMWHIDERSGEGPASFSPN